MSMTPKPYSQVRQLGPLEFLDIVFADIGADDGIVFSVGDQRVWFPPRSPDIPRFIRDNPKARISLVSLNDHSFGFAVGSGIGFHASRFGAPSLYLVSIQSVGPRHKRQEYEDQGCAIWLFEEPVKLDDHRIAAVPQIIDFERCSPIPGLDSWRRKWEGDAGETYAFEELFPQPESEAEAQDAACDVEPERAANV